MINSQFQVLQYRCFYQTKYDTACYLTLIIFICIFGCFIKFDLDIVSIFFPTHEINFQHNLHRCRHRLTLPVSTHKCVVFITANKSGIVAGIPPQVPPMINTQYIMSQATGFPYLSQPTMFSYDAAEAMMIQQRIAPAMVSRLLSPHTKPMETKEILLKYKNLIRT